MLAMRPAFVVPVATISQFACEAQQPSANTPTATATVTIADTTSAAPTSTAEAAATAGADPATKRKRPVKKTPWITYDGKIGADAKALNPRDGDSRMIFARRDGHCYVTVPLPPEEQTRMRGGVVKVVDCPDAMQHQEWDSCLGGTMYQLANDDCICRVGGNPPPPPAKATCPPKS
jgi:hypothetical protein